MTHAKLHIQLNMQNDLCQIAYLAKYAKWHPKQLKNTHFFCFTFGAPYAMFDNLQEILQIHLFVMSRKFEMQNGQWHKVKQIISIFADKRSSVARFEGPFYYFKRFLFLQRN